MERIQGKESRRHFGGKEENIVKSLQGTKTEANLMTAFAGESQARNKYTYYASKIGRASCRERV